MGNETISDIKEVLSAGDRIIYQNTERFYRLCDRSPGWFNTIAAHGRTTKKGYLKRIKGNLAYCLFDGKRNISKVILRNVHLIIPGAKDENNNN